MRAAAAAALVAAGAAAAGVDTAAPDLRFPCNPATFEGVPAGCRPTVCGRHWEDDFVSPEDVATLRAMVQRGFARSSRTVGPTILDANTGFMRDDTLQNIYRRQRLKGSEEVLEPVDFTSDQFAVYGGVFTRIHARLKEVFNISTLHFTAPTFVTRILGSEDQAAAASDVHDEYWHPHVDQDNTAHYHYSGLMYLSTHGDDFTGGQFEFLDAAPPIPAAGADGADETGAAGRKGKAKKRRGKKRRAGAQEGGGEESTDGGASPPPPPPPPTVNSTILPRAGRLLLFTSGKENLHRVAPVTGGERLVFSMWFTCDARMAFTTFLDGKAHVTFENRDRDAVEGAEGGDASGSGAGSGGERRQQVVIAEDGDVEAA